MAAARADFDDRAAARVEAVLRRHHGRLLWIARRWSGSADDAEDALRRAMEIYVRRLDSLDPATGLAWLKVVVRNEALAIRARAGRRGRRADATRLPVAGRRASTSGRSATSGWRGPLEALARAQARRAHGAAAQGRGLLLPRDRRAAADGRTRRSTARSRRGGGASSACSRASSRARSASASRRRCWRSCGARRRVGRRDRAAAAPAPLRRLPRDRARAARVAPPPARAPHPVPRGRRAGALARASGSRTRPAPRPLLHGRAPAAAARPDAIDERAARVERRRPRPGGRRAARALPQRRRGGLLLRRDRRAARTPRGSSATRASRARSARRSRGQRARAERRVAHAGAADRRGRRARSRAARRSADPDTRARPPPPSCAGAQPPGGARSRPGAGVRLRVGDRLWRRRAPPPSPQRRRRRPPRPQPPPSVRWRHHRPARRRHRRRAEGSSSQSRIHARSRHSRARARHRAAARAGRRRHDVWSCAGPAGEPLPAHGLDARPRTGAAPSGPRRGQLARARSRRAASPTGNVPSRAAIARWTFDAPSDTTVSGRHDPIEPRRAAAVELRRTGAAESLSSFAISPVVRPRATDATICAASTSADRASKPGDIRRLPFSDAGRYSPRRLSTRGRLIASAAVRRPESPSEPRGTRRTAAGARSTARRVRLADALPARPPSAARPVALLDSAGADAWVSGAVSFDATRRSAAGCPQLEEIVADGVHASALSPITSGARACRRALQRSGPVPA